MHRKKRIYVPYGVKIGCKKPNFGSKLVIVPLKLVVDLIGLVYYLLGLWMFHLNEPMLIVY